LRQLARFLATVGYLGEVLPAPGTTAGSLAGVGVFLLTPKAPWGVLLGVVLTGVAVVFCGLEAARRGVRDPGPVVLDEVVGQWWALSLMAWGGVAMRPWALAAGFALFRLLDVLKPPPIRQVERLPGGYGIVADDLLAGLVAGLLGALAFGGA